MHGFPDNLHIYDRLIPLLQGHQVITFDFLDWGDSDLGEKQSEVARHFATSRPDKFADLSVSYGELGVPLLDDMLATIKYRVVEMVSGGTHTVFLAEVEVAKAREGMPLTYFRGRMGRFADIGGQHATSLERHAMGGSRLTGTARYLTSRLKTTCSVKRQTSLLEEIHA